MFSLYKNWLVKICPAFKIQRVKLTYHIGLSIQKETKKEGKMTTMRKGQA